jgi:hypothetical protein
MKSSGNDIFLFSCAAGFLIAAIPDSQFFGVSGERFLTFAAYKYIAAELIILFSLAWILRGRKETTTIA